MTTTDVPTFSYFPIRGRIELIRMMFEDQGKEYKFEPVDMQKWPETKQKLIEEGISSQGQAPFYKDSEIGNLSQSAAIATHVAHRLNVCGKNNAEAVRIMERVESVREVQDIIMKVFYDPECKKKRDEQKDDWRKKLTNLENFLFHPKTQYSTDYTKYLVGDSVSLADYVLVFFLDAVKPFIPDLVEERKQLEAFRKQFHQRPNFKAYCASDRRPKTFSPGFAAFGGKVEETQQGDE